MRLSKEWCSQENLPVRGHSIPSDAGIIKRAKNAKVGVFSCPIDISQTETKGTVLLHNAKEMLEFSKGEEVQLEKVYS